MKKRRPTYVHVVTIDLKKESESALKQIDDMFKREKLKITFDETVSDRSKR